MIPVIYQFSRSQVERCDFHHFLSLYGLDRLPTGPRLRALMNCFVFGFMGWDADPREIHMIPEIRRLYAAFHDAWPNWLYFCNLQGHELQAMTFCCLPTVTNIQVEGQKLVKVRFNPLDLLNFIKADFLPMNVMCERAEMSERSIFERTKGVVTYFDFPFDAQFDPES